MSPSGVDIRPVRSRGDVDRFIRLPWKIYKGDANWVPPLIRDEQKLVDPNHNPFFEHAEIEHFLAYRGGEAIGRIAAIQNRNHNEFHEDKVGFFGMFESIDAADIAGALLDTASAWLGERGLDTLRGPMNYSTNETCGTLIDGTEGTPYIMMPHNPKYYPALFEGAGLAKAKDLVAYHIPADRVPVQLIKRVEQSLAGSPASVRSIDKKKWDQEVEIIRTIYNNAWEKNWGFVPYTAKEFDHMAKSMKQVVEPELVAVAEFNGKPIGFGLALPDMNLAMQKANGRLFPFGLIRILLAARNIKRLRVPILGVLKEFRGKGLDGLLYVHLYKNAVAKGYTEGELSWILEDNVPMRRILDNLGCRVHRTYRIYDRPVT